MEEFFLLGGDPLRSPVKWPASHQSPAACRRHRAAEAAPGGHPKVDVTPWKRHGEQGGTVCLQSTFDIVVSGLAR